MSEHTAEVSWERGGAPFDADYSRSHTWSFDGGVTVPAASSPQFSGDPSRVDPEEAFVASISSCHMLWFLHLARDGGWVVDSYRDRAVGRMARTTMEDGRRATWLTHVTLRPEVRFSGSAPSPAELDELHHQSHERCFIANSVRSEITVEPVT